MLYTEVINWTCKVTNVVYYNWLASLAMEYKTLDYKTRLQDSSLIKSVCEKLFQTNLNKSLS